MRAEGNEVSIARLCRWFGVPRSTFYYRAPASAARSPVLDAVVVGVIRKIIEKIEASKRVFAPIASYQPGRLP